MRLLCYQFLDTPISIGLATLALAVTCGLALGAVRIRGMRLGISGVLFSALLFGQIGLAVKPDVLQFLRDFALIVYIYSLGLQVGPGFLTSLRAGGFRLNVLAIIVLALGAVMAAGIVRMTGLEHESQPGIYAGAFTTTPGLAAGQEALRHKILNPDDANKAMATAAQAYSVTYPFGIIGPILVIVLLRRLFGVRLDAERKELAVAEETRRPPVEAMDFEVTEPAHSGISLREHPLIRKHGVVFSRIVRDGVISVPTGDTEVRVGDIYRAVGTRTRLAEMIATIGRPATINVGHAAGDVERMELVVTRTQVLRRSLAELNLIRRYGVTVARLTRAGVDLVPKASLRLAFADQLTVVGPAAALKQVETEVGNCPDTLNRPQLIPIFVGIVLGVMVGSVPLVIPGLHTTLRIGLAGGPLLAAIALSQLGNLGSVVWYMPVAANALFRDFGLAVFLACVGLEAGNGLLAHLMTQAGLRFVLVGAVVTVLPVFIVGCVARMALRMNFITLSGWVAGAMTSSTSLAFANDLAKSDAPAVSYAAVAPLATLVPIICAQLLAV